MPTGKTQIKSWPDTGLAYFVQPSARLVLFLLLDSQKCMHQKCNCEVWYSFCVSIEFYSIPQSCERKGLLCCTKQQSIGKHGANNCQFIAPRQFGDPGGGLNSDFCLNSTFLIFEMSGNASREWARVGYFHLMSRILFTGLRRFMQHIIYYWFSHLHIYRSTFFSQPLFSNTNVTLETVSTNVWNKSDSIWSNSRALSNMLHKDGCWQRCTMWHGSIMGSYSIYVFLSTLRQSSVILFFESILEISSGDIIHICINV